MTKQKLLHLTITKISGPVFEGDVYFVTAPGSEGELTILPNHSAFITPLKKGVITLKNSEKNKETYEVEHGMLEVSNNQATLLI